MTVCLMTRFDLHVNTIARPQRELRLERDLRAAFEIELPLLSDAGKAEHAFDAGKGFAKTGATAGGEWKVGEARPLVSGRRVPAFRIETRRLGIPPRIAMRDVLAENDDRARADRVLADLHFLHRASPDRPERRIQADRLGKNAAGQCELRQVVDCRLTATELLVYLAMESRFDLRMLREQIPGERHRIR